MLTRSTGAIDNVSRLGREFCVRDIMRTGDDLVCAETEQQARALLQQNRDFDVIPIRRNQALCSYVERGKEEIREIRLDELVTESTGLLDAVDVLKDRPFAFVLVRDRLAGYIHFSDFNHPVVKVPFFILIEAVERKCFEKLTATLDMETLRGVLSKEAFERAKVNFERQRLKNANLSWAAVLSFRDKLLCARHRAFIKTNRQAILDLAKVRNLVSHAGSDQLVMTHEHINRLVAARETCLGLLEELSS